MKSTFVITLLSTSGTRINDNWASFENRISPPLSLSLTEIWYVALKSIEFENDVYNFDSKRKGIALNRVRCSLVSTVNNSRQILLTHAIQLDKRSNRFEPINLEFEEVNQEVQINSIWVELLTENNQLQPLQVCQPTIVQLILARGDSTIMNTGRFLEPPHVLRFESGKTPYFDDNLPHSFRNMTPDRITQCVSNKAIEYEMALNKITITTSFDIYGRPYTDQPLAPFTFDNLVTFNFDSLPWKRARSSFDKMVEDFTVEDEEEPGIITMNTRPFDSIRALTLDNYYSQSDELVDGINKNLTRLCLDNLQEIAKRYRLEHRIPVEVTSNLIPEGDGQVTSNDIPPEENGEEPMPPPIEGEEDALGFDLNKRGQMLQMARKMVFLYINVFTMGGESVKVAVLVSTKHDIQWRIPTSLANILGFIGENRDSNGRILWSLHNEYTVIRGYKGEKTWAVKPIGFDANVPNTICLYCNLVAPVTFGDTNVRILECFPLSKIEKEGGNAITWEPKHLNYIPITKADFNNVRFELRGLDGKFIAFSDPGVGETKYGGKPHVSLSCLFRTAFE